MPLAGLLAAVLEQALEAALALDPATREGLQALSGRRLELSLEPPGLALLLIAEGDGRIRVSPGSGEAELSLRAGPGALLARLAGAPLAPGSMRVAGDLELARTLERLLSGYQPDLERPFALLFGDLLGPQLARFARGLLAALARQVRHFAEDLGEWMLDREGVAVSRGEAAAFYAEVEALREAVDRLEKRVERLVRTLAATEEGGACG